MKYLNCPTCGGLARYISENFEHADILISAEDDRAKKELVTAYKVTEILQKIAEIKIQDLNSDQLYYLYRCRLQQEVIEEQNKTDKFYKDMMGMTKYDYDNYLIQQFSKLRGL